MLRALPNLRSIVVGPTADVAPFAQQVGRQYVLAWRPSPAEMVSRGWDEARTRHLVHEGLGAARGCNVHVHLEATETVEGDPDRLRRWTQVVRSVADELVG